jgi:hypothetical protein
MNRSTAKLSPLLRFAAAGMLLVWFAAVTACSTGCLGEDAKSESAQMMQADGKCSPSHDSDKHDCHDNPFCLSLHSLCPQSTSMALIKPDFALAFTLNFASAVLVTVTPPETSVSRQPPDGNRVFTPEVSLGAAFHSLAPPILT